MAVKTALITGANKGIGFEIARQLGKLGWQVWLGARAPTRGKAAVAQLTDAGLDAHFLLLDVSDPESVSAAYAACSRQVKRLDVLINNAAILLREDRDLLAATPEMIQRVLQTNAIGGLNMVQTFLPLLGHGSRVIFMSSGGGSMTDPIGGWAPVYCICKSLLNAITRHLDYTLHGRGIAVDAVCPGWVRTDMGGRSAPRSVERGAETAVWLADSAPASQSGLFWRDKKIIPW